MLAYQASCVLACIYIFVVIPQSSLAISVESNLVLGRTGDAYAKEAEYAADESEGRGQGQGEGEGEGEDEAAWSVKKLLWRGARAEDWLLSHLHGNCDQGQVLNWTEFKPSPFFEEQTMLTPGGTLSHTIDAINDRATCSLPQKPYYYGHPPHAAQYLYKCWSFWQANAWAQPVLQDEANVTVEFRSWFSDALLELFRKSGVRVVVGKTSPPSTQSTSTHPNSLTPSRQTGFPGNPHRWFFKPSHAVALKEAMFGQPRARRCPPMVPRVVILMRNTTRVMENEQAVVEALQAALGSVKVETKLLEGLSFQEQAEIFNSNDILISPHGSQLLGLPFMPQCGGLLEIYPKRYFMPGFFGALAKDSGLQTLQMYLSSGDPVDETESWGIPSDANKFYQKEARNVSICPAPNKVVEAVMQLLESRKSCVLSCLPRETSSVVQPAAVTVLPSGVQPLVRRMPRP